LLVFFRISAFNLPERNTMKSWFGSSLLLAILLAFGCTRGEPQQDQAAPEKSVDAHPPAVSVSTNGEDAAARDRGKGGDAAPKPGANSGRKFALLVGVTRYDNLSDRFQLKGPANDVVLMRATLKDRFAFADKDIVTLAEGNVAAARPTRANIKREFDRLAKEAGPDDQVFILLGGHGSQQPDQEPFDEPDGLDETFLPCDAGPWDGSKEMVTNAVIDDELEVWTKAIVERGAALFLIIDACHSGTMLRGGGDEVLREITEGDLVPEDALKKARQRAAAKREATRGDPAKTPAAKPESKTQRLVALYASQPHEPTVERSMPPDGAGTTRHGLFTYTICQILTQAQSPLSYRELAQRIQAQYVQWGRVAPTPLLDGLDQDREVLGTHAWPGRSQFVLATSEDGWKIRAGQLHGLTDNSILAVYPPPGQPGADKVVGHVRVRKSQPTDAEVEPCAYAKMPIPKTLAEGGRCELVFVDYGSMRLRVGMEAAGKDDGADRRRVREMLKEIAKSSESLIELVADGAKADVVARVKGENAYLVAVEIAQLLGKLPPGATYFGPYSAQQTDKMRDDLTRIARARNLLKLVSGASTNAASDLEIEMVKLKGKNDKQGQKLKWGPTGLVLQPGDFVGWRVTNRGRTTLDVTLLFIDSGYGIDSVFPRRGSAVSGENRFLPDQSHLIGPARVNPNTIGLEHMMVIAVKGEGQPVDFTCLAQPTLEKAEEAATRGSGKQVLGSPLGRLLQNAMYAQGAARGLDVVEADTQVLRLLSWSVQPPPTATKK
jgi:hypothetical protein